MITALLVATGIAQLLLIGQASVRAFQEPVRSKKFPTLHCMVFSALLAVTAWLIAASSDFSAPYIWLALGMTFSFIGDLSMASLLPWRHPIVGGILTFGIGHVCYLVAFYLLADQSGRSIVNSTFFAGAAILIIVQLLVWRTILNVKTQPKVLVNGAAIYGFLVGGTAVFAAGLWQASGGQWLLPLLGGILFVLSDFFIGWYDIGGRRLRNPRLWIWVTYGLAQICIIYAPLVHQQLL